MQNRVLSRCNNFALSTAWWCYTFRTEVGGGKYTEALMTTSWHGNTFRNNGTLWHTVAGSTERWWLISSWWHHQIEIFFALLAVGACGEFTVHRWIPLTKVSDAELWCFLASAPWINNWANNREATDLKRYRVHYDVIVMVLTCINFYPKKMSRVCFCWIYSLSICHYMHTRIANTHTFPSQCSL